MNHLTTQQVRFLDYRACTPLPPPLCAGANSLSGLMHQIIHEDCGSGRGGGDGGGGGSSPALPFGPRTGPDYDSFQNLPAAIVGPAAAEVAAGATAMRPSESGLEPMDAENLTSVNKLFLSMSPCPVPPLAVGAIGREGPGARCGCLQAVLASGATSAVAALQDAVPVACHRTDHGPGAHCDVLTAHGASASPVAPRRALGPGAGISQRGSFLAQEARRLMSSSGKGLI